MLSSFNPLPKKKNFNIKACVILIQLLETFQKSTLILGLYLYSIFYI